MENGNASKEARNKARLTIMELTNMTSVPMSLNAVVRLNVADAIWNSGSNTPLTASQILERILPAGRGDAENLNSILRMLTTYGVFSEHLDANGKERKFSLTEVGKTLVTDQDGHSYAAYILQHNQDVLMGAWSLMYKSVVDSSADPFAWANGEPAYKYYGKRPEMNELMQKAMSGISVSVMSALLDGRYDDGFKGVKRLVDVGGSAGISLRMILEKYPHIQEGINFDSPEVVAKAPTIPRMTHVGGDFLKSVPAGDAIFTKWVLSTWADKECKMIMENCYNALPAGGKFIVMDTFLPETSDDSQRTRALIENDVFMMTIYRATGKNRSEAETRQLAHSVGFSKCRAIYDIDYFFAILEFQK